MSSAAVTVSSQQLVRHATPAALAALGTDPIPLGPLDQLLDTTTPIAVVFIYPHPAIRHDEDDEFMPVARLQCALAHLLDYYPHLAGRFHIDPPGIGDGTPSIISLSAGVPLLSASCPAPLSSFKSPSVRWEMSRFPSGGAALNAPFDSSPGATMTNPLLSVQHTRFACGGVALGLRTVHKVCDGDGFFQLVRHLAELHRQLSSCDEKARPTLAQPPHWRSFLSELRTAAISDEERAEALAFTPSNFYLVPASESLLDEGKISRVFAHESGDGVPTKPPPPVVGRVLRFSASELGRIKVAAQTTTTTENDETFVSTFDALTAHLFRHIYRAQTSLRHLHPNEYDPLLATDFLTVINLRKRLPASDATAKDGIPPAYFPNALLVVFGPLTPSAPLPSLAAQVRALTHPPSFTTRATLLRTLRWLALQPDKTRVRQGFRYGSGSLLVSQWTRFDMYAGTVFERGVRPVMVQAPFTRETLGDGLILYLPTEEDADEGIDVSMALSEPVWAMLDDDEEFRRFEK